MCPKNCQAPRDVLTVSIKYQGLVKTGTLQKKSVSGDLTIIKDNQVKTGSPSCLARQFFSG